jgi:hypothetical protein
VQIPSKRARGRPRVRPPEEERKHRDLGAYNLFVMKAQNVAGADVKNHRAFMALIGSFWKVRWPSRCGAAALCARARAWLRLLLQRCIRHNRAAVQWPAQQSARSQGLASNAATPCSLSGSGATCLGRIAHACARAQAMDVATKDSFNATYKGLLEHLNNKKRARETFDFSAELHKYEHENGLDAHGFFQACFSLLVLVRQHLHGQACAAALTRTASARRAPYRTYRCWRNLHTRACADIDVHGFVQVCSLWRMWWQDLLGLARAAM